MLAVISPAKTFGRGQCALAQCTQPDFLDEAARLIVRLKKMTAKDLCGLMGVSPAIAELNVERYAKWKKSPPSRHAERALLAFRGDVYRSLNADSFAKGDFEFAQNHLRILSGLYGVLRPFDLIQAYRLEMGTRLETGAGKTLYQFWGDKITRVLNRELAREKTPLLVNLASAEYWNAVDPGKIDARIITPVFKEKRGGAYKVIGVSAKRARGMMARYIITNRLRSAAAIKRFNRGGYSYRENLSNDDQWVFARAAVPGS